MTEISEQLRQFENRTIELQTMLYSKEEQLRIREQTLDQILHDIRGPLANILGISRLLRDVADLSPADKTSFLEALIQSSQFAIDLSAAHLRFGLLEKCQDCLTYEKFDLLALLYQIRDIVSASSQGQQQIIINLIPGDLLIHWALENFQGDKLFIYNALNNLITNALEALPPGQHSVSITLSTEIEYLIIDIHNLGTVPEEIRDDFFGKYKSSGKPYGTGLGTYIANLIVKRHFGSISFTSNDEDGTHVIIKIPY